MIRDDLIRVMDVICDQLDRIRVSEFAQLKPFMDTDTIEKCLVER